jgi:hypothetical protein
MAAAQRFRQGIRALLAFTRGVDYDLAAEYLSPGQLTLFRQMRRSEQLHSLNVLRSALAQGPTPDDLAVAALLHDVGKVHHPLAIWQKSLAVIVRALAPGIFRRWSRVEQPRPWQLACVVAEQHPAWSAELAAAAGTSERALWLISNHDRPAAAWGENHPHVHLLKRLQAADDAN